MRGQGWLVSPLLVGRDDLLALADRRLGEASRGAGGLLFLAGEAGIGKTRLLAEIERRAAAAGFRVAHGGTYPGDLEVAAAVLIDLARAMSRVPPLEAHGRTLAARLDAAAATGTDGDAHRRRRILVLDLANALADVAADSPTLLALEDLHQADDLTLEVLAALADQVGSVPMLVVGTYRSDELYPRVPMRRWRSLLVTQRLAEEARLARLDLAQTATLVASLIGEDAPLPTSTVEVIQRRTDGFPLHIEELVGLLVQTVGLRAADIDAVGMPDTLEDAILGRLDQISPRAREVADLAAVIGRSFEYDLLVEAIGGEAEGLADPLAELADQFVLAPLATSGRYGFRHSLICDAIYDRLPEPRRRRLHREVADRAAARGEFSIAFLSLQYERAGMRAEAFETARQAAQAANDISSHREAYELYQRVLRNVPADVPIATRGRIIRACGLAASACDDNASAAALLEAARADLLRAREPVEAAAIVPPLVAVRHLLGDGLEARVERLEEARNALEELPEDPGRNATLAQVLAGLSAAYMLDRQLEPAIVYGEAARSAARSAEDPATERHAAITVGVCYVFAGRMDDGWRLLEDAIGDTRAAGLEAEAARAYRMIGSCASVLVEYERAERSLREGIDYAERVELWNDRHYMAAHLAHVLWATGRWTEAAQVAERALADGRSGITTQVTALHVLGYLALGRGELDRARSTLEDARVIGERMRELQRVSPALWGLAETELAAGDPVAAIRWCDAALEASAAVTDTAYLYPYLVTGVRAHLAAHDPAAACAWFEDVAERLRQRSIPGTLPAIPHAEGLLALAGGGTRRARQLLGRAVREWQTYGRTWEGLAAELDLAESELRGKRPAEAIRLARTARERALELPAPAFVTRADGILARGRARSADEDAPWSPLTARELQVARLVGEGLTNAEIGEELGMSSKTAASHVEHILAKLGMSRRAEIATWVAALERSG